MLTSTSKFLIFFESLLLACLTVKAFDDDFTYYPSLKIHYKLIVTPMNWFDAKLRCASQSAYIAMPANQEEASVLFEIFKTFPNNKATKKVDKNNYFLGFHDMFEEGEYITDSGLPIQYYFHKFEWGQPDNNKNKENCGGMNNNGKLNDLPCDDEKIFICERREVSYRLVQNDDPEYKLDIYSGKYFKLHIQPKNWNRAREMCQAEGGRLALIESNSEREFLKIMFSDPNNRIKPGSYRECAHLGFHDLFFEDRYYTVYGEPLSKFKDLKWGERQPDNYKGKEHCGCMQVFGTLNDSDCSAVTVFFCEKPKLAPFKPQT